MKPIYCVISTDETNKVLDVKKYNDENEYYNDGITKHSQFEKESKAISESKRIAKMCNGISLAKPKNGLNG